jgi:putative hydrolase of the HAD superfamily
VSRWQAIIFDLDDTLYPERDYVLSGFRAVAAWAEEHLGIQSEQGWAELRLLFEQGVRGETFNRWLAAHDRKHDGLVQRLVQVYREHQPVLTPFPGVPKLLDSLRRRYRLGLVSDGYLAVQRRKLAALDLADRFDAVVFSDQWGREAWKPSTRPFNAVLDRLAIGAAASAYVADNPSKDFLGARQVGMFTVWMRRSDGVYAHLSPPTAQHAPDLIISSLEELEGTLA